MSWWIAYVLLNSVLLVHLPRGHHIDVGRSFWIFDVSLVLRGGLDLLGLRRRWAIVVMTIVRVGEVALLLLNVGRGHNLVRSGLPIAPLLFLATWAGWAALSQRRESVVPAS
jgi:hypothetical protein